MLSKIMLLVNRLQTLLSLSISRQKRDKYKNNSVAKSYRALFLNVCLSCRVASRTGFEPVLPP